MTKIAKYNHFDLVTEKINEGEDIKDAWWLGKDTDTVPSDYTEQATLSDVASVKFLSDNLGKTQGDYFLKKRMVKAKTIELGAAQAIDIRNDPPGSPSSGDKHEVGSTPSGAWVGQSGNIATWDGAQWLFQSKVAEGFDACSSESGLQLELAKLKIGTNTQQKSAYAAASGGHYGEMMTMYRNLYHNKIVPARNERMEHASSVVFIEGETTVFLWNSTPINIPGYLFVRFNSHFTTFVSNGSISFEEDGITGIIDGIYGSAGSDYEGNGLLQESIVMADDSAYGTLLEFCDATREALIGLGTLYKIPTE